MGLQAELSDSFNDELDIGRRCALAHYNDHLQRSLSEGVMEWSNKNTKDGQKLQGMAFFLTQGTLLRDPGLQHENYNRR
jgi:hypothetical protein